MSVLLKLNKDIGDACITTYRYDKELLNGIICNTSIH